LPQIDVERRFHQLDVAVVHDQPLAQSRRHGRLAADDQQAPAASSSALMRCETADWLMPRASGLVETAMADHGVQHGQRAVIQCPISSAYKFKNNKLY
jgi:hypothetical protein